MSWRHVVPYIAIGVFVAPAMSVFVTSNYLNWAGVFLMVALPGAIVGMFAAMVSANKGLTLLGAVVCGWVHPYAGILYLVGIGKMDVLDSITWRDSLIAAIVAMAAATIAGGVPVAIQVVLRAVDQPSDKPLSGE